jgi:flagellar motor switch protein FliN
MSVSLNYLECWTHVATSLLSQALAGEPSLSQETPKHMTKGAFGFAATIEGEEHGQFTVTLDGGLNDVPLLGEGIDQKTGWAELLKEIANAAAGELLMKTGRNCQVTSFVETDVEGKVTQAFRLKAGNRSWSIHVADEVELVKAESTAKSHKTGVSKHRATKPDAAITQAQALAASPATNSQTEERVVNTSDIYDDSSPGSPGEWPNLTRGLELLLDVELEASLRFGAREMPLSEILDLGPGDVVQLDRHVNDPVDLIVGDKIVARGDVVLVNGNFGLRVTEVAEPQRRLETIRCLF